MRHVIVFSGTKPLLLPCYITRITRSLGRLVIRETNGYKEAAGGVTRLAAVLGRQNQAQNSRQQGGQSRTLTIASACTLAGPRVGEPLPASLHACTDRIAVAYGRRSVATGSGLVAVREYRRVFRTTSRVVGREPTPAREQE